MLWFGGGGSAQVNFFFFFKYLLLQFLVFFFLSDGYAQVIQQSYGVWHTKCFPKPNPPNAREIEEICKKLGFTKTTHANGRIIYDQNDLNLNMAAINKSNSNYYYQRKPTKVMVLNDFSILRVHEDFEFNIKPSRPTVKVENWNELDERKCFRVEVRCE